MQATIEARELITLDGLGVRVRGTYHKTVLKAWDSHQETRQQNPIGVLFFNSLSLPRAATGDSAVYWADSFAEYGFPSFRIDLPGLGDSNGDIPPELLDFINAGGYATIASAKIKELVERFGLSGVVVFGHCAGATSAIYAAASCVECKGLILMDPYFHVPQAVRPKMRRHLSDWALRSRLGRACSNVYDRLRNLRLSLRRNAPPGNANKSLLSRWKEVASTGLP